jgi:hypothetical protein
MEPVRRLTGGSAGWSVASMASISNHRLLPRGAAFLRVMLRLAKGFVRHWRKNAHPIPRPRGMARLCTGYASAR